ncbi:MAG TPA: deoxyhypusine synthase family protein [Anaerolineae bacterium]|nr:deoxyhypusine synthase family protein [Anaerolineae bacterium]
MEKKDLLQHPIRHLDLYSIEGLDQLLRGFEATSFQSRNLAKSRIILENMQKDETATIFLGIAGAIVPGGLRKVIRDMIKNHFVDVLVSTGANLTHDFIESMGFHHYVGSAHIDDAVLEDLKIDRIYDTYVDNQEFETVELTLSKLASELEPRGYSSREFLAYLGSKIEDPNSILRAAYEEGIPVFCPALCDSAIGIGLTHLYAQKDSNGRGSGLYIDQIRDNYEIAQIKLKSETTGAIYVGGGVPKNYIQQLEPLLDTMGYRQVDGHKYAIQITTDDPKWGGLSGCTFEEAQSWGKITKDAQMAIVYLDSTIGLPLIVGAFIQSNKDFYRKRNFSWVGDQLERIER